MTDVDDAVLLEELEGLADRGATDVELSRQRHLGRQLIAGLQTFALDQFEDLKADLQG